MKKRSEIYAQSQGVRIIVSKLTEIQEDVRFLQGCLQSEGYDPKSLAGGANLRRAITQASYWSRELLEVMLTCEKTTKAMDDLEARPG